MRLQIINHWQINNLITGLVKLFFILGFFLLLFAGGQRLVKIFPRTPILTNYLSQMPLSLFEGILYRGLPNFIVLEARNSGDNNQEEMLPTAVQVLTSPLAVLPKNMDIGYPLEKRDYEIPPFPVEKNLSLTALNSTNPTINNPLIAIYNTHNAESYRASQGKAKFEGENGGVEQVAAVLAACLTDDYGIPVVRSTTIHDYPDFALSYGNSEKTLKKMLAENPSVLVALDIHRDAGLASSPAVEIAGRKAAQILIIVGSDTRLEHPKWHQNEAFAQRLQDKMDKLYPGLCRGIRVQEGRYNQHLLPRSLLLEIGSDNNTLAEAEYSARLIAKILAEIIGELLKENPTV